MTTETITWYNFICSVCGKKDSVKVECLWKCRDAVKPDGWVYKLERGFYNAYCGKCK